MNYYIVVEGPAEKRVYKDWIKHLRPELNYVKDIFDINNNHFSIISGGGYPQYFEIIESAIEDVNSHTNIDKLIISIDSEDMTFNEQYDELNEFLSDKVCSADVQIIIQHFCFETWALGNKRIGPRNPERGSELHKYKAIFNVLNNDPELLPNYPKEELNRSQFALKYLVTLLKAKNSSYSKRMPNAVINNHFFEGVKKRCVVNNQIGSFKLFLEAFS